MIGQTAAILAAAKSNLDRLIEVHAQWIKNSAADGTLAGYCPCMFVSCLEDDSIEPANKLIMIQSPFNEHEEKHGTLRQMGRLFYDSRSLPAVIIVVGDTIDGQNLKFQSLPIGRNAGGKIIAAGDWELCGGGGARRARRSSNPSAAVSWAGPPKFSAIRTDAVQSLESA